MIFGESIRWLLADWNEQSEENWNEKSPNEKSAVTTIIFYRDAIIDPTLANTLECLLKNAGHRDPGFIYYFAASGATCYIVLVRVCVCMSNVVAGSNAAFYFTSPRETVLHFPYLFLSSLPLFSKPFFFPPRCLILLALTSSTLSLQPFLSLSFLLFCLLLLCSVDQASRLTHFITGNSSCVFLLRPRYARLALCNIAVRFFFSPSKSKKLSSSVHFKGILSSRFFAQCYERSNSLLILLYLCPDERSALWAR